MCTAKGLEKGKMVCVCGLMIKWESLESMWIRNDDDACDWWEQRGKQGTRVLE